MKDKIINILTYLFALVVIGSVVIHLVTSKSIKGLTQIALAFFLLSYSFDKNCKYNKLVIRILSVISIVWGIVLIVLN